MATKEAETKFEEDVAALREQLERVRAELAGVTGTLQELAGDAGDEVRGRVRAAAAGARAEARRAGEAISSEIQEKPLASLAIAFIIGLLFGALFSRSR